MFGNRKSGGRGLDPYFGQSCTEGGHLSCDDVPEFPRFSSIKLLAHLKCVCARARARVARVYMCV